MTQEEEKQLLAVDLSARLTYGVRLHIENDLGDTYDVKLETIGISRIGSLFINGFFVDDGYSLSVTVKPYLRPMSSMTEEEEKSYRRCRFNYENNIFDWFNAHHFDFRNLIDKKLAVEAPKGMYKKETEK